VTKRIARQHLGLYPPHGADQHRLDSLPRVLQGLGQREGGHEVAAGAASRKQNLHHPTQVRNAECGVRSVKGRSMRNTKVA